MGITRYKEEYTSIFLFSTPSNTAGEARERSPGSHAPRCVPHRVGNRAMGLRDLLSKLGGGETRFEYGQASPATAEQIWCATLPETNFERA